MFYEAHIHDQSVHPADNPITILIGTLSHLVDLNVHADSTMNLCNDSTLIILFRNSSVISTFRKYI